MEKITITIADYLPDRAFYRRGNNKKIFQYVNTEVYNFIEKYRWPWTKHLIGKKFKIPADQDFGYLIRKNQAWLARPKRDFWLLLIALLLIPILYHLGIQTLPVTSIPVVGFLTFWQARDRRLKETNGDLVFITFITISMTIALQLFSAYALLELIFISLFFSLSLLMLYFFIKEDIEDYLLRKFLESEKTPSLIL